MNKRRYPIGLFITGFFITAFLRLSLLMIPGLLLIAAGAFWHPLLFFGVLLVGFDIFLALATQLKLRRITLTESDDPEFKAFQDAILSGNWRENIKRLTEEKADQDNEEE